MPTQTASKKKGKYHQKTMEMGYSFYNFEVTNFNGTGTAYFHMNYTDGSETWLAAVSYQDQNGQKRVISYASRSLTQSEKNYPPYKLEFFALK